MTSKTNEDLGSSPTASKLKSPRRWGRSLAKTGLWFCVAFFATAHIAERLPAYPILVQTNSIDPGLYWVNKSIRDVKRGDTVSFRFIPRSEQLKQRLGESGHTKQLLGFPGDTVKHDLDGSFKVCSPQEGFVSQCSPVGTPLPVDSKGRPLDPWIAPGKSITLGSDEYWMYAPNPKSLDSRYNGPVKFDQIEGKATPIYLWGSYLDN